METTTFIVGTGVLDDPRPSVGAIHESPVKIRKAREVGPYKAYTT